MSQPPNTPPKSWADNIPVNAAKNNASSLDRFKGWALQKAKDEFEGEDIEWVYLALVEAYRLGKADGQRVLINGMRDLIGKYDELTKQVFKAHLVKPAPTTPAAPVVASEHKPGVCDCDQSFEVHPPGYHARDCGIFLKMGHELPAPPAATTQACKTCGGEGFIVTHHGGDDVRCPECSGGGNA